VLLFLEHRLHCESIVLRPLSLTSHLAYLNSSLRLNVVPTHDDFIRNRSI
jgi:hypothetical protein